MEISVLVEALEIDSSTRSDECLGSRGRAPDGHDCSAAAMPIAARKVAERTGMGCGCRTRASAARPSKSIVADSRMRPTVPARTLMNV